MKSTLFISALIAFVAALPARAQERYDFVDHTLSFAQIEKEWQVKNFYTATFSERPSIKECVLSVAQAYPNDMLNMVVCTMMGYDSEGRLANYVLDERNGFFSATLLTELDMGFEMCLWRLSGGATLVAVAVNAYEYNPNYSGDDVDDDTDRYIDCTDLMFFRIDSDGAVWWPIRPQQLLDRTVDFHDYVISLPRVGKDIKLTPKMERDVAPITFRWNEQRFGFVSQ